MSYTPVDERIEEQVEALLGASKALRDRLENRMKGRDWTDQHREECASMLHRLIDLELAARKL